MENAGDATLTSAWRYDSLTTAAAGMLAKSIGKRVRTTGGDNTRRDYRYDHDPGDGILCENAAAHDRTRKAYMQYIDCSEGVTPTTPPGDGCFLEGEPGNESGREVYMQYIDRPNEADRRCITENRQARGGAALTGRNHVETFRYDRLNRLTRNDYDDGSGANAGRITSEILAQGFCVRTRRRAPEVLATDVFWKASRATRAGGRCTRSTATDRARQAGDA